ncbi:hypothetical protein AMTR_s00046p00144310 [Amborella trichopoda]|uniref:Uncharacterized protein n=1 Tax=Amborella trichopoda TaxID=13333 RepID=U5D6D5_AMBTC|nr:hypothetical protein AMTR_s00046p00144310 [Amborella trichopoda]
MASGVQETISLEGSGNGPSDKGTHWQEAPPPKKAKFKREWRRRNSSNANDCSSLSGNGYFSNSNIAPKGHNDLCQSMSTILVDAPCRDVSKGKAPQIENNASNPSPSMPTVDSSRLLGAPHPSLALDTIRSDIHT